MTRAHTTARMRDIDMESIHAISHRHDLNPVVTLHRKDLSKFQRDYAAPRNERSEDRVYCPDPNCNRSYLQFRSEKRHAVLDHHMRYDNRTKTLIPFESHEAFQIAYAKNKGKNGQPKKGQASHPLFIACHLSKDRRWVNLNWEPNPLV